MEASMTVIEVLILVLMEDTLRVAIESGHVVYNPS